MYGRLMLTLMVNVTIYGIHMDPPWVMDPNLSQDGSVCMIMYAMIMDPHLPSTKFPFMLASTIHADPI